MQETAKIKNRQISLIGQKFFINKLSSGKNAYRIIMGIMTTWILTIAFEADKSAPTEILLDLFLFSLLLLATNVFAGIISEEIIVQRQTSLKRAFELTLDVSPVLLAAIPPFIIFLIASFGFYSVNTGLLLSDLCLLTILFFMGFFAGRSISGIRRGVLDGFIAIIIGVCLVLLRGFVI